ncbi:MAG: hypothetical protein EP335_03310 [Alphaproteobacteria bacterium]|nr:MAG: hypothetical protein EP335_03310 [Alphaproteobacteria bacterium]
MLAVACGPGISHADDQTAAYHWQSVTVGAGGFAPDIVFSTAEPGLAYLRTDMGGAYRWDDKQGTWIALQDSMPTSSYMGIESLAADPIDPDRVYVATGMYRGYDAAMLRSDDRGGTWEIFPVPYRMGGNEDGRGLGERLAIDPDNRDRLYFGSRHDGLLVSEDRGEHWTRVESFPHKGVGVPPHGKATNAGLSFVLFGERTPDGIRPIFVGVADRGAEGLYRSDDGGASWQPAGGPQAPLFPAQAAAGTDGYLYVTWVTSPGPNGVKAGAVWRLAPDTGAWTDITPTKGPNLPPGGYMAISTDRQHAGTVVVASMNRWKPGDSIWRSTDHGDTWTDVRPFSKRDVSATPYLNWGNAEADFGWWIAGLAIDPFKSGHVAYTTGATVYATDALDTADGSAPLLWKPWIDGIEQTAIITLRSLPEGPVLLSGFGDLSGFAHTDLSRSPIHQFTNPVFANTNVIDYAGANPALIVRSGTPGHRSPDGSPVLAWSADHGLSWQPLHVPAVPYTRQGGKAATQQPDLSGNSAIAVSADGDSFIVASDHAIVSHDRGQSWRATSGLPAGSRPVADRTDATLWYAMHFASGRVLVSTDGGDSFKLLPTKGLPSSLKEDRPTWREQPWPLMAAPGRTGELWYFSAANERLYRSTDGGLSFRAQGGRIAIKALAFGKAAQGQPLLTLFALADRGDGLAIWRSTDGGASWLRLNDARHQYGRRFRTIEGDMRTFGRVYVGTDGRGILLGDSADAPE